MTKIKFELSDKPTKVEKVAEGKSGFVPVKARWVIERTNERCKILGKDFERIHFDAATKLNLCFLKLMLIRLAENQMSTKLYRLQLANARGDPC